MVPRILPRDGENGMLRMRFRQVSLSLLQSALSLLLAFTASGLAPGEYSIEVSLKGFANFESGKTSVPAGGVETVSVTLEVEAEKQQVTVVSDQASQVSLAPSENAGAVTLRGA